MNLRWIGVVLLSLSAANLNAQVVHHWAFDPGPDFMDDLVGPSDLKVVGSGGNETSLPSAGRGEAFPTAFSEYGPNLGSAAFGRQLDGFVAQNAALEVEDFTIELFTNVNHFARSSNLVHFVSQASPAVTPDTTFWSLQARTDNFDSTKFGELNTNFGNASTNAWHAAPSGIVLAENTDYFLGVTFEVDTKQMTYYVQDLAKGHLQIGGTQYRYDNLRASEDFLIGDVPACGCRTDGLIDELRISKGALDFGEMLISQAEHHGDAYRRIETINIAPRTIYRATEDSSTDYSRLLTMVVSGDQKGISKFVLPDFVEPAAVESATLRFYVNAVLSGDRADLRLWHSTTDNDYDLLAGDFSDPSYRDTERSAVVARDEAQQYYDFDVTDFILQDYGHDPDALVASFRLEALGDSRVRVAMPRSVEQQPLLLLSLKTPASGDFDGDGALTDDDLDLLAQAMRDQSGDMSFDLNQDGAIDDEDRVAWVHDIKSTWFGDTNLDGEFNTSDLIAAVAAGKYEAAEAAGWASGDYDGDGLFSTSDLVFALADGGYELGRRAVVRAVPEPSRMMFIVWAIPAAIAYLRRR